MHVTSSGFTQSYCLPCCRVLSKEYFDRNRDKVRKRQVARRYKITEEQVVWFKSQTHCAVCGHEKPLVIDHCHTTGRVRGAVCEGCNLFMGFLEKRGHLLQNAMAYLEKHR